MTLRHRPTTNLWHRFDQVARESWNRLAVDDGAETMTYGGLHERAVRIAALLAGSSRDSAPVLLLYEHVAEAIPAILACCRLGRPYVPVRPGDAPSRVALILENSGSMTILTQRACLDRAKSLASSLEVFVSDDSGDPNPDVRALPEVEPADNLWIIYTSGSTGRPKGVVQTHGNLAQYAEVYANRLSIVPEDRISLLLSYSSNFANHLLFMALLNGATLCPYDVHQRGSAGLREWVSASRVSILVSVPTLFRHAFDPGNEAGSGSVIRWVMLIGEPVSRREFEIFEAAFPSETQLCNRYGSTETGTIAWSSYRAGDRMEETVVPIGQPGSGFEVLLLGPGGEEVAEGEPGEMVVRSEFLASGYWADPERTAEVFSDDPERPGMRRYRTGDLARLDPVAGLIHLGRKDFQVQVRGHRVEPAEVEAAIRSHPKIDDVFVHVLHDRDDGPRIVGYLLCGEQGPTVTALRQHLALRIPEAMIPSAFVELDAFPLAPNGKVNRSALPLPTEQRPRLDSPYVPPVSPFECLLAEMWRDLLRIDEIGLGDSFFDLGGDSLKAMRLMARIEAQFGMAPGLEFFHEHPMIDAITGWLRQRASIEIRRSEDTYGGNQEDRRILHNRFPSR